MNVQLAPVPIAIEHLKHGKLVSDADERVPYEAGYGITRRSSGVTVDIAQKLAPRNLLDHEQFEPRLVDRAHAEAGVLVARYDFPFVGGHDPRLAVMRAGFLPEGGRGAAGRVFQQATVWRVPWKDWLVNAPAVMEQVIEQLPRPAPDRVSEPERARVNDQPLVLDLPRAEGSRQPELASEGAAIILDALRKAPTTGNYEQSYGPGTFASEADFLRACAEAISLLGPTYREQARIVIVSGLNHTLHGICLRYLLSREGEITVDRARAIAWASDIVKGQRPQPAPAKASSPPRPAVEPERPRFASSSPPPRAAGSEPRQAGHSARQYRQTFEVALRQPSPGNLGALRRAVSDLVIGHPDPHKLREHIGSLGLPLDERDALFVLAAEVHGEALLKQATFAELSCTVAWRPDLPPGDATRKLLDSATVVLASHVVDLGVLIPAELSILIDDAKNLSLLNSEPIAFVASKHSTLHDYLAAVDILTSALAAWYRSKGREVPRQSTRDKIVGALKRRYEKIRSWRLDHDINCEFVHGFVPLFYRTGMQSRPVELLEPSRIPADDEQLLGLMLTYLGPNGPVPRD